MTMPAHDETSGKKEYQTPWQRLSGYAPSHLYNLLCELDDMTGSTYSTRRDEHSSQGHLLNTIRSQGHLLNIIRNYFTEAQVNEANRAVCRSYVTGKRRPTKQFIKGRPLGSKNKIKHEARNNTPSIDDIIDDVATVDAPAAPTPVQPETEIELDDDKLAKLIHDVCLSVLQPFQTKNNSEHDSLRTDTSILYNKASNFENELVSLRGKYTGLDGRLADVANSFARDLLDVNNRINAITDNRPTIIQLSTPTMPELTDIGIQHKCFPMLLKYCNARFRSGHRHNIWVYGPAGTGKSVAAQNVAKALGLKFYVTGSLAAKHEVLGFCNAHTYVSTPFRQAWEHGGIYCMDEADGSSPPAMLALNGALAGGICEFPDRTDPVPRHPDCVVICTANTAGAGATSEYSGRFKMDAASMDRFDMLYWPLDEGLEEAFCANKEWLSIVRSTRAKIARSGQKGVMITPRATLKGESLLAAGVELEYVITSVLKGAMTDEQWAMFK